MLLNGYVLSPLGCQNWALKMSLWWKLCQGQLVPAVTYFVGRIGCLAAPDAALPCQQYSPSLYKSCGLALKGSINTG